MVSISEECSLISSCRKEYNLLPQYYKNNIDKMGYTYYEHINPLVKIQQYELVANIRHEYKNLIKISIELYLAEWDLYNKELFDYINK